MPKKHIVRNHAQISRRLLEVMGAVCIFYLTTIVVFNPEYRDQSLGQHDIEQFVEAGRESNMTARKKESPVYWTGSIFSGMPTYTIKKPNYGNLLKEIPKLLAMPIHGRHVGFLISMIAMFFLGRHMQVKYWWCVVFAIAFGLGTNYIIAYRAGHLAKIESVAVLPFILLALEMTLRKRIVFGSVLLAVSAALLIEAFHAQLAFYAALAIALYLALRLPPWLKQQSTKSIVSLFSGWALALVIGIACNASLILATLEYAPLSTRGEVILEKDNQASGLIWKEDGRPFSVGVTDLMSAFVPRAAGGSTEEHVANFKRLVQKFSDKTDGPRLGVNDDSTIISTYWGKQIQSEGPLYLGMVIFVILLLSFFFQKNIWNTWALLMLILGISMNVFMGEFLHNNVPLFDKFRAHGSIMLIVYFAIVVGVLASVNDLFEKSKKSVRMVAWRKTGIACLILFGVILILSLGNDYRSPQDASNIIQNAALQADQNHLQNMLLYVRKQLFYRDFLRSIFFAGISMLILYFGWVKKKEKTPVVIVGLLFLSIIDIMVINYRYLNAHQYNDEKQARPMELKRASDFISEEMEGHGRIFNAFNGDPFSNAKLASRFKLVNGYNPAKLRRYDDVIDTYLREEDRDVLNMLNTKYKIGRDGRVLRNRNNFGNAWLVDEINLVHSNQEEFDSLSSNRLNTVAFVHKEFTDVAATSFTRHPNDTIELVNYAPERLVYQVSIDQPRFAVFSEIWYGPNKGWKAFIDGVESQHVRVNYLLRGMLVPAGQHEIVFSFEPEAIIKGTKIAKVSSSITLLLLAISLLMWVVHLVAPQSKFDLLNRLS